MERTRQVSHNPYATQPCGRRRHCPCPQPGHRHGCVNRYYRGCRCPDCKTARRRRNNTHRSIFFDNPHVPAVGTARRLQGLAVAGWSPVQIATRLQHASPTRVDRWRRPERDQVEARTARMIADLCDQIWDQPPAGRYVLRVRRTALRMGWVPLLAWDDIDDPDDQPQGLRAGRGAPFVDAVVVARLVDGQPAQATRDEVDAAIMLLTELGLSAQDIQARFAVPISTRWVQRARARARLEVAA